MILADQLAHTSHWRTMPLAEKTSLSLGLVLVALAVQSVSIHVVLTVLVSLCARRSGCSWANWLRLLSVPTAFVLTADLGLFLSWGDAGPVLRPQAWQDVLHLLTRCTAAAAAMLLLTVTTPAPHLLQGMRHCGLSAELAETGLLIYRFVFIFHHTALTMLASQQARLSGISIRRRIHGLGLLVAALFPRALDHARRLDYGLSARGFSGSLPTLSRHSPIRPWRLAAIILLLICLSGAAQCLP